MKGTNAQNKASLMRWRQKKQRSFMNSHESMLRNRIKRNATILLRLFPNPLGKLIIHILYIKKN